MKHVLNMFAFFIYIIDINNEGTGGLTEIRE